MSANGPGANQVTIIEDAAGNEFNVGKELGHGVVGRTYRSTVIKVGKDQTHLHVGQQVALKSQPVSQDPDDIKSINREVGVLTKEGTLLASKMAKPADVDQHNYIVQPIFPGVNLRDAINGGQLTQEEKQNIATGLLKEIDALQKLGIVHCDIKPDNILYDKESGTVKIIDMGQAFEAQKGNPHAQFEGPGHMYMPPETYATMTGMVDNKNSHQTDLYGIGIIIASMYSGKDYEANAGQLPRYADRPADFTPVNHARAQLSSVIGPDVKHVEGMPDGLLKIAQHLLAADPAGRPQNVALARGANEYEPINDLVASQQRAAELLVTEVHGPAMKAVKDKPEDDPVKKKMNQIFSGKLDLSTIATELSQMARDNPKDKKLVASIEGIVGKINSFNATEAKKLQADRTNRVEIPKQEKLYEASKKGITGMLDNVAAMHRNNNTAGAGGMRTFLPTGAASNASDFDMVGKLFFVASKSIAKQKKPEEVEQTLKMLEQSIKSLPADKLGAEGEQQRTTLLAKVVAIQERHALVTPKSPASSPSSSPSRLRAV